MLALVSAAGTKAGHLGKTGAAKDAGPPAGSRPTVPGSGNEPAISFGALVGKILGLTSSADETLGRNSTLEGREERADEAAEASRLIPPVQIGCVPQPIIERRIAAVVAEECRVAVPSNDVSAAAQGMSSNSSHGLREIVGEIPEGIATLPISPPVQQLDSQPVCRAAAECDTDLPEDAVQPGTVLKQLNASTEGAAAKSQTKTAGSGVSRGGGAQSRSGSSEGSAQVPKLSEEATRLSTNTPPVERNAQPSSVSTKSIEKAAHLLTSCPVPENVPQPVSLFQLPTGAGVGRDEGSDAMRNVASKTEVGSADETRRHPGGDDSPGSPAVMNHEVFTPPFVISTPNIQPFAEHADRTTPLHREGGRSSAGVTAALPQSSTFDSGAGRQQSEIAFYANMSTKAQASRGAQAAEARLIPSDRVDLRFGKYVGAVPDIAPDTPQKLGPAKPAEPRLRNQATEDLTEVSAAQARRTANFDSRRSSGVFSLPQHNLDPVHEAAMQTTVTAKQRDALLNELGPPSEARELPKSGPAASVAMRDITVQVRGRGEGRVEVTLHEQGGRVQVVVRAADKDIAASLRAELNELARVVEEHGYHIDTWTPSETAPGQMQPSSRHDGSDSQPWNEGERGGQQGSSHEHGDQKRRQREDPEWLLELQRRLSGEEA